MLLLSSRHVDCSLLIFPLSVWLTCKITLPSVHNSVTFTHWPLLYQASKGSEEENILQRKNYFVTADRTSHWYFEHYNSETQFIKIFSHYSSYHLSVSAAQNVRLQPRSNWWWWDWLMWLMCLYQGALSYWANSSEYDQDWDISED